MKPFICFYIIFLLVISICADTRAQEVDLLKNEIRLLESEHTLAKNPVIYFIFNLKEKEVLLKSRGVVLRGMRIEDMRFWGGVVKPFPCTLMKKSTLFKAPQRITIDPNKNKEEEKNQTNTSANTNPAVFDVDALELKDMPTSYYLDFQEGIFISISTKGSGFLPKLYSVGTYAGWYVSRPLLTIWNSIKGRPFTSIYLVLNEEDARLIYWALVENSENIIYQP